MANVRRGDNKRESWWVTNLTNQTITIGDLLLAPVIKPGKRIDLLYYYSREKISHSTVLNQLVKAGIVSLNKDKIYDNEFAGTITSDNIDEAVTPAEENEIVDGLSDFIEKSVVTEVGDPGSDDNIVTEQGIREQLIDEVTEGEEITTNTEGVLLYGKDPENTAQPVSISGPENDELKILSIDEEELLEDILNELIKANMYMSIITGDHIKNRDIDPLNREI